MEIEAIDPNIWGPSAWNFIHYVALAYPMKPSEKKKQEYFNFYNNLHTILPCPSCSDNYKEHLKEIPLTKDIFENNESLFRWTVQIHNLVNKDKNKKEYTFEEALDIYINPKKETYDMIIYLIGFIFILLFLSYLDQKYKLFSRLL